MLQFQRKTRIRRYEHMGTHGLLAFVYIKIMSRSTVRAVDKNRPLLLHCRS